MTLLRHRIAQQNFTAVKQLAKEMKNVFEFIQYDIGKELLEPELQAFLASPLKFCIYRNTSFLGRIESVSGALIKEQTLLGISKTSLRCPYLCAETGNR